MVERKEELPRDDGRAGQTASHRDEVQYAADFFVGLLVKLRVTGSGFRTAKRPTFYGVASTCWSGWGRHPWNYRFRC